MVNSKMCVKRVAWMFCVVFIADVAGQEQCTDLRGRLISHGLHYVPGPDTCTLCVCDNGLPKVCKAVLCSPPQDCRSFRVGTTCCEFICLDDVVKPAEGAEANVRVAAGGAAAVVLLTVALVAYRVRRQKRRRARHNDDQRSLTSIGYISGSMGYMGGTCETALAAWKPPGHYLPRGEAPPPYDEAVAQTRQDMRMSNEMSYHRTYPATVDALARPDDTPCAGHGYINIPRPVAQVASGATCYSAALLQHAPDAPPHHALAMAPPPAPPPHNVVGFPSAIRLTGSLGAISNRGLLSVLQREPEHERPHNVPGFYTNGHSAHAATSLHRTIPRISAAGDASLLDAPISGFSRADRSLHGEIRRSFHKPSDSRQLADTGRSMPRNLNLASAAPPPPVTAAATPGLPPASAPAPPDTCRGVPDGSRDDSCVSGGASRTGGAWRARAHSESQDALSAPAPPAPAPAPPAAAPAPPPAHAHSDNTLPLTVDKPSCVCSYEGGDAPAAEDADVDADDYRSECENCKSASSSRWVLEEGWEAEGGDGTQTLQRRAPPPAQPPPATATLPQPVTKQARSVMGPPSNWENWFNTIPDSDSESEEE